MNHQPTIFPGSFCIKFSAHKVYQTDCREPTVTVDGCNQRLWFDSVLKVLADVTKRMLCQLCKAVATEGNHKGWKSQELWSSVKRHKWPCRNLRSFSLSPVLAKYSTQEILRKQLLPACGHQSILYKEYSEIKLQRVNITPRLCWL